MKRPFKTLLFLLSALTVCAQYRVETDVNTGKKGSVDPIEGFVKIPFEYDDLKPWPADTFLTATKSGLKGVITQTNREVVPLKFEDLDISEATGRHLGYIGTKRKGLWGLYHLSKGEILAVQFEFVRALSGDLLAGRLPGDTLLHFFFNGRGRLLLKTVGESAWPGYDKETVEIIRADKTRYFIDMKGQDPFRGRFPNGRWTDGKLVICSWVGPTGLIDAAGLLTWEGDTILPCIYRSIEPFGPDRFLIKTRNRQTGLADGAGNFVIPLSDGKLSRLGKRDEDAYLLQRKGDFSDQVFDFRGAPLLNNIRTGKPQRPLHYTEQLPDRHLDNYFTAFSDYWQSTGLYHSDGREILPMQYKAIKYASDRHPLIVHDGDAYVIMGWDGQKAYPDRFKMVEFTFDPRVFYGQKENTTSMGFILLDQPQNSLYHFEKITPLYHPGFFSVKEGTHYFLHSGRGQRINPKAFIFISSPERKHYTQWREKKTAGKLVAIGKLKEGLEEHTWIGFDDKGKTYEFKWEAPDIQENWEVVQEKVVEEVSPLIHAAPPPVLAEPAQGEQAIVDYPDQMPEFPGGEQAKLQFITDNLKYPFVAKQNALQGKVYVSFVVEKDGSLSDIATLRDIGGGCGAESVRIVGLMPKWKPGIKAGQPVRCRMTIPVQFKLQE